MVFKVKTIAKIVSENSHHPYIPFPSSHPAYIYDTLLTLYPTKLLNFSFIIPELCFSWKYVHVCMFLATHFLLDKRLCTKPIWTFFFFLTFSNVGIQLINNGMLVSGIEQSDSVIHASILLCSFFKS